MFNPWNSITANTCKPFLVFRKRNQRISFECTYQIQLMTFHFLKCTFEPNFVFPPLNSTFIMYLISLICTSGISIPSTAFMDSSATKTVSYHFDPHMVNSKPISCALHRLRGSLTWRNCASWYRSLRFCSPWALQHCMRGTLHGLQKCNSAVEFLRLHQFRLFFR